MSKVTKSISNFFIKHRELLLLFLLLTVFCFSSYLYLSDKILPNVYVNNIALGLKTKNEALEIIKGNLSLPKKIELTSNNQSFEFSLSDIETSIDYQETVNLVFKSKRENEFFKTPLFVFLERETIKPVVDFDRNKLAEYLEVVSAEISVKPIYPELTFNEGVVVANNGQSGEILDETAFITLLKTHLENQDFSLIEIPLTTTDTTLNENELNIFKSRGEKLVDKVITITLDGSVLKNLTENEIFSFVNSNGGYNENIISDYIGSNITSRVNSKPQNAVFSFESGSVKEFVPSKDGLTVDESDLKEKLINALIELESNQDKKTVTVEVPVMRKSAAITTANVNSLGINELIGRGSSTFRGSISERVHNVSLASSKFNSVLIPPGETFSFNKTLGDVSTFTGYQQAYVIKDGKTVLGDGGGVCQVSTTLFRAALNTGLPIVERRAHSYRVGYYEQDSGPGLDATVYDPSTDLKIKNDTPAYLLIQTIFSARTSSLVFEIYGTNDGRVSTITKPVILSSTPPPEDLYIDDPTLPSGQIKQIDYKAWGAKVSFDYKVTRGGEILFEKTFLSNYRPWQAVFLRGTGQ